MLFSKFRESNLTKDAFLSKVYCHTKFQSPILNGAIIAYTS